MTQVAWSRVIAVGKFVTGLVFGECQVGPWLLSLRLVASTEHYVTSL